MQPYSPSRIAHMWRDSSHCDGLVFEWNLFIEVSLTERVTQTVCVSHWQGAMTTEQHVFRKFFRATY